MSSRADKALKGQKDKHHAILRELVQELPNKVCAECLAKGPRWSSWSLGVFVCIRCAGIHRNLGVHISKMKSIDLDSWTAEQLQNVLRWGNHRAAEYFECYLPKDYVRPQTNHALESFIRNKYEKKLYMKKDGEPPENPESKINRLKNDSSKEEKADKEKKQSSSSTSRQRRTEKKQADESKPNNTILNIAKTDPNKLSPIQKTAATEHQKSHSMNDLLSLDNFSTPSHGDFHHAASTSDLLNFGAWSDPAPPSSSNDPFGMNSNTTSSDPFANTASTQPSTDLFATSTSQTNTDLFASSASSQPSNDLFSNSNAQTEGQTSTAPTKSTKESILSLYGSGGGGGGGAGMQQQQPQMFGVPGGMYTMNNMVPQQQQQHQQQQQQPQQMQNSLFQGYQQQGTMNQMNQMNMQMQQMNFNQRPQQMMIAQQKQPQQYNPYNQQRMMYNPQQQQQRPMMQNQMMAQQQNFNMMQQPQGNMGWTQQGMMGQQQGTMGQQQMSRGMTGNLGMNNGMVKNSSGTTMNNLLWN